MTTSSRTTSSSIAARVDAADAGKAGANSADAKKAVKTGALLELPVPKRCFYPSDSPRRGCASPVAESAATGPRRNQLDEMARSYATIISHLGEDGGRQGLLRTPQRAAEAMLFFTKGYEQNFDGRLPFCAQIAPLSSVRENEHQF